ncbi:SDR family oxidoreductase [candidate division KSB1 bacterium]|nr:SDR family oxidoreductase [candidate division KSB1 bacterium]
MESDIKIVLITGCSSGIGRELAEAWHEKGYAIYATARDISSLIDLADKGIHPMTLDVTSEPDLKQVIQTIEKEQGRLDILVNNAGYGAIGPAVEMPMEEIRLQFDTNMLAPMALIQAALPLLRRANKSTIVQIGSVSADFVSPFAGVYCASKAALHALSDALRMELAPFGIRVIIAAPGAIRSKFGQSAENGLERTLKKGSIYQPILGAIQARARASQDNPTAAAVLVQKIVNEVSRGNPRPILRVGNGARALLWLDRLLPVRMLDQILMKRFQLDLLDRLYSRSIRVR